MSDHESIKRNLPCFLWFGFNILFACYVVGFNINRVLFILIIYCVTLYIALSDVGEKLIRLQYGMRELQTRKERDYLLPIFNEVYQEIRKNNPKISSTIHLYTMDTIAINAYALGSNTIAVTRGLIETATPQELKAVVCHEFAHIIHQDSNAVVLVAIGNGFFSILSFLIKLALKLMHLITEFFRFDTFSSIIANIFSFAITAFLFYVEFILIAIEQIGAIILGTNSKKNEFGADKYCYDIGYSNELISYLYKLHDIDLNERKKLLDSLKSTHPYITERIGKLENY